MPDDVEPVVRRIQKRFRNFSVDMREGASFAISSTSYARAAIWTTSWRSYLTTHTDEPERIAILKSARDHQAIEEETHKQFARYQPAAESAAGALNSRADSKDNLGDPYFC